MAAEPRMGAASAPGRAGDADIFFRAADRAVCENLCDRMVADGMNVAILAANSAGAEHYCRILVRRLAARPAIELEIHPPGGTAELLESFNETLATLSTAEAMVGRNPAAPLRIYICNSTDLANRPEGRLLVRLVNNFPGANTQLILLQTDVYDNSAATPLLDMFGQRLLRWRVEPPSRADATLMIEAAERAGTERETRALLARAGPQTESGAPRAITVASEPSPAIQAVAAPEVPPAPVPENIPVRDKRGGGLLANAVLGIVVVTLAAVVVMSIYPRQAEVLRRAVLGPPSASGAPRVTDATGAPSASAVQPAKGSGIPDAVDSGTATPAPAVAAPAPIAPAPLTPPPVAPAAAPRAGLAAGPSAATTEIPPDTPGFPKPATKRVPLPPAENVIRKPPAPAPVPVSTPAPASAPAPAPTSASAPTPAPAPQSMRKATAGNTPAANDNAALQAAVARVRATPKSHAFVQHIALDSYDDAKNWLTAHLAAAQSLIVPVAASDRAPLKYVVLSGPFVSRKAAQDFTKKKMADGDVWIRSAASLIDALQARNQPTGVQHGR